jgi:hypothetical protein
VQQGIADRMAERVVHLLELVEIETQHRDGVAALHRSEMAVKLLAQEHAVGQRGQRIVMRHVGDLLLGLPLLGDVLMDGDPAAVGHRLARDRDEAPVLQPVDERKRLLNGVQAGAAFEVVVHVLGTIAGGRCGAAGLPAGSCRAAYRYTPILNLDQ